MADQMRRWNGTEWVPLAAVQGDPSYYEVDTMLDVQNSMGSYGLGKKVMTRGYYSVGDGGGAEYIISSTQLPWSIPLGSNRFANIIKTDYVNYRMFGATLTGTRNADTQDIKKAHLYADSNFTWDENKSKVFHTWVKNHDGIIRVTETIYCSGNVDLSGSTIIVDDVSSTWFGTYVWGQNASEYYSYNFYPELRNSMKEGAYRLEGLDEFPENVVMHLTETHYEIRDDDGYLYDVNKGELMVHKQGGIFSTALGSDWDKAGGTLIFNENENEFMTTELVVQYTYLTSVHRTFIGCEVIFDGNPNNYCSVIWIKGHNCTVRDFTFRPKPHVLANTAFKNSMIYVWGSYKVTIKNCNGMNASGKITPEVPTPTSGYAIRAFQACDLVIEDCNIMGIWGSISVSSTKNCYMSRVTCNRIDVHDYIVNLFVNACIVYSHMFQIGYGSGSCVISDSVFYYQHIPEERYPTPYLFALQTGYGRIFNGKIAIQNCKMIFLTKNTPKEFSLIWARFRPDARSVERKYRFPDITIRDFSIDTVDPDSLSIIICDFRGQTKNNTSAIMPPITSNIAFSGTTKWQKVIETRNFSEGVYYFEGEIIRKMDRYLDSKGKTVFHSIEYYNVLSDDKMVLDGGQIRAMRLLPVLDPITGEPMLDPQGNPIMKEQIVKDEIVTTRIYAPYFMPGARYNTVQGTNFVVAIGSKFFPEEVFTGNTGSKTAGDFPTHKSGDVWYGDDYGDGFFLRHETDNITVPDWRPNMSVTTGQYFTIETKVFQAVAGGTTGSQLLEDVEWLSTRNWGSASVKYIGSLWMPGTWAPETGVILVYSNPGYNQSDFKYNMYRVVKKDGRTLGDNLLSVSGIMLDGGITWERTSQSTSQTWSANTAYNVGAVVSINGVAHRVISNSTMNMPKRMVFNNIVHNSLSNPYLFNFEAGTSVKVAGQMKVVVDSMDELAGISKQNRPFFGLASNPQPAYATIEQSFNDSEIVFATYDFVAGAQRWSRQNVNRSLPNINIGRLEIVNNNSFDVNYNFYESYDYGSFAWTELLNIRVNAGDSIDRYIMLSGTRNDFVVQTRAATSSVLIDAPNSVIRIVFSNKTNNQSPDIICP